MEHQFFRRRHLPRWVQIEHPPSPADTIPFSAFGYGHSRDLDKQRGSPGDSAFSFRGVVHHHI